MARRAYVCATRRECVRCTMRPHLLLLGLSSFLLESYAQQHQTEAGSWHHMSRRPPPAGERGSKSFRQNMVRKEEDNRTSKPFHQQNFDSSLCMFVHPKGRRLMSHSEANPPTFGVMHAANHQNARMRSSRPGTKREYQSAQSTRN